jgi:large subunit ribosomal protein L1
MAEKKVTKKSAKKAKTTTPIITAKVEIEADEIPVNLTTNTRDDTTVSEKPKKAVAKKATPSVDKTEKTPKTTKAKNPNKLKNSEKRHARKYREVEALVDREKEYSVEEAMELLVKTSTTKFDSSTEVHIRLNIDPQNAEQQVRGSLVLPHGTGKTKRVLAIVSPEKEKESKDAGADFVGGDDMIAKIEKGWLDFDVVVATPDMMPKLGKIGKILGTKGLMPNPKVGTVTPNVGNVVGDIKKGMIEYRVDKSSVMHLVFGKVSFGKEKLAENYNTLLDTIVKVRPNGVKGTYIKGVSVATTMGPGVKVITSK